MGANLAIPFLEKFRFPVRYPPAAVEIDPGVITAVRVRGQRAKGRLVGFGLVAMPEPVSLPTILSPRVGAPEDLRKAVGQALEQAGIKSGKMSLVIPDTIARVWILQLPELPRKAQALAEMIRWKIKRSVPFRIEDTAIVWEILARPSGTQPAVVLVGLVPRPIIAVYEGVVAGAGLKVGLVDLSTFNLFNFYRGTVEGNGVPAGDFSILNATASYFTLLLFRGGRMAFYRCKSHPEATADLPDERLRSLRRDLATSLSYYTEKLAGKGLAATFVRITDPALEGAEAHLESLGLGRIERIDPGRIAALPLDVDTRTALALTPAMGAALGRSA